MISVNKKQKKFCIVSFRGTMQNFPYSTVYIPVFLNYSKKTAQQPKDVV